MQRSTGPDRGLFLWRDPPHRPDSEEYHRQVRLPSGAMFAEAPDFRAYINAMMDVTRFPFREFPLLRREGNYAKRHYLSKKRLKEARLVHQDTPVPRSLVYLCTAHCGGKQASKELKKLAKELFGKVLAAMGDREHECPDGAAREVVLAGRRHELLRDEIFCQLIKQTTENPRPGSALRGWKLLYLCLVAFPPSEVLAPYLLAHLGRHAVQSLVPHLRVGFASVAEVATHCFAFWYKNEVRHMCRSCVVPATRVFTLLMNGGEPLFRAQELGARLGYDTVCTAGDGDGDNGPRDTDPGDAAAVGRRFWGTSLDQLLASRLDILHIGLDGRVSSLNAARPAAPSCSSCPRSETESPPPPPPPPLPAQSPRPQPAAVVARAPKGPAPWPLPPPRGAVQLKKTAVLPRSPVGPRRLG